MLDEFEKVDIRQDLFQDWSDDWRAKVSAGLFALVIASKRPIYEYYYHKSSLTSPLSNIFSTTVIGAMEHDAWLKLLQEGFSIENNTLNLIKELAGRLPFYTQMAAALVWQHSEPERIKAKFSSKVTPHWEELWQELTDAERRALKVAAGISALDISAPKTQDLLQRFGLIESDGRLFSNTFAEFVRGLR
jgi:hypothetical protein